MGSLRNEDENEYVINTNMGSLRNGYMDDNTNEYKENITKGKNIDNYTMVPKLNTSRDKRTCDDTKKNI